MPAGVLTFWCFNTWAREEPNQDKSAPDKSVLRVSILGLARSPTTNQKTALCTYHPFQYLGSRGAQPPLNALTSGMDSFNTWAREEPNKPAGTIYPCAWVSILGLARSPTRFCAKGSCVFVVSILGLARSPTRAFIKSHHIQCFNTWAREEPNFF